MKLRHILIPAVIAVAGACRPAAQSVDAPTACNPIDIAYRYTDETPIRRECADPSVFIYQGEYYLFASKSDGYYHSTDLVNWDLILCDDLPCDLYAPTVAELGGQLIYCCSTVPYKFWRSVDVKAGIWEEMDSKYPSGFPDPAFFRDDDGRLYFYYGHTHQSRVVGVELDTLSLQPISETRVLFEENRARYGWEVVGDRNERDEALPWLEGLYMTKYDGKYYLQYASPGTQYYTYCDGVYVGDSPLGPFTLARTNPMDMKAGGFANGTGHGCTFKDLYGNWWHMGTISVSVKHKFERRLSLHPVFFDKDGEMAAYTGFGDYPFFVPQKKMDGPQETATGWMLLSYGKKVEASSTMEGFDACNAVDECIRTYWSAESGEEGEYISVDLGSICTVRAVQFSFADNGWPEKIARDKVRGYRYSLLVSRNGKNWEKVADSSDSPEENCHPYIQLENARRARYVKLVNRGIDSGKFSLYGFRVFGNSHIKRPDTPAKVQVHRNGRYATIKWDAVKGADGYNVRYGETPDAMYHDHMVYGAGELTINSLNADWKDYWFSVSAFNEGGVSEYSESVN